MKQLLLPPKWLQFLIVSLLVLSVFFRLANLDQKVYTTDEVRGLLRISGYRVEEFQQQAYNGKIISVTDLLQYQRPNSEKNITDAIKALAGNPEHPPLYYLMARFWTQLFNNPVGARIFSVITSLFVFPCLYWLCLELFESPLTGWIAIALTAVSPFQLMIAQEARQYSLWAVAILLSSTALIRALRLETKRSWAIYTVTLALGIYTHLFSMWVLLAQGLYLLIRKSFKFDKTVLSYFLASGAACLAFFPWILVVLTSLNTFREKTSWVAVYRNSLLYRAAHWLGDLTFVFVDFSSGNKLENSFKNPLVYFILILVLYSIYFLIRHSSIKTWSFILLLIGVTALAQVIPDLVLGGRRSMLPRYLTPCYIGVQLSVAYLLATQITTTSISFWKRRLWQFVFAVLISAGVISCAIASQDQGWWKGFSSMNLSVAPVINQAEKPLVITDASPTSLLPLSYLLRQDVKLQLLNSKELDQLKVKNVLNSPKEFSDVFVYFPSSALRKLIEAQNKFTTKLIVRNSEWFSNGKFLYQIHHK